MKIIVKCILYLFNFGITFYGVFNSDYLKFSSISYLLQVPVYTAIVYLPIQNYIFMDISYNIVPEVVFRYGNKIKYFLYSVFFLTWKTIIGVFMLIVIPLLCFFYISLINNYAVEWELFFFLAFRYFIITLFFNLMNFSILIIFKKIRQKDEYKNIALVLGCPILFIIMEIINMYFLADYWFFNLNVSVPDSISFFDQIVYNIPIISYTTIIVFLVLIIIDRIEFYI